MYFSRCKEREQRGNAKNPFSLATKEEETAGVRSRGGSMQGVGEKGPEVGRELQYLLSHKYSSNFRYENEL